MHISVMTTNVPHIYFSYIFVIFIACSSSLFLQGSFHNYITKWHDFINF